MVEFDEQIANEALHLAMEWGADFRKPTQPRLAKLHPDLSQFDLDQYDHIAQAAMAFGNKLVYEQCEILGLDSGELWTVCRAQFVARYPWASEQNFNRLFTQGMYYAWHDGVGG